MSHPDGFLSTPVGTATSALEQVISRFEKAWQKGHEAQIDDYLLSGGDPQQRLLIELIFTDLEYRLRAGESVRIEAYLQRYPELASNPTVVLDLISAEFRLRQRAEMNLGLEEFLRRFPQHRQEIIDQLQAASGQAATLRVDPLRVDPILPLKSTAVPTIPGYEMLGLLGQGGMGVVYQARQTKLNRLVALKMIRGGRQQADVLTRFLAEAQAVARLQHASIVQIFEAGDHAGQPYIALEFIGGGSLQQKLAGQPLPPRAAAQLLVPLAQAIHAAHQRGIVHRDLKPGNVLLTEEGATKITDFGLVKYLDEDSGQTSTGAILGTPSYMAPEQAEGKVKEIGPAADVYALGALLYEMLTGRPPFRGATSLDTLEQVRSQEPVPPSRLQPEVPRDLETICLKCLQKDPRRRYASAAELADDMGRYLVGEPIRARPVSDWAALWRWCQRNPSLAWTSAVAAGAVGMAVAFFIMLASNVSKARSSPEAKPLMVSSDAQPAAPPMVNSEAKPASTNSEEKPPSAGSGDVVQPPAGPLDQKVLPWLEALIVNKRTQICSRWASKARLSIFGATREQHKLVCEVIAELNQAPAPTAMKIELLNDNNPQTDICIHFVPQTDMLRIAKEHGFDYRGTDKDFYWVFWNGRNEINRGVILLAPDLDDRALWHSATAMITRALGVCNKSNEFADSIFGGTSGTRNIQQLSALDKKLLVFLYNHLQPGDGPEQLRAAFAAHWAAGVIREPRAESGEARARAVKSPLTALGSPLSALDY